MSVDTTGANAVPEDDGQGLVVGPDPAASMGAILSFLAPEADEPAAGEGGAPADAAAAGAGQQPAAAEGAAGGAGVGGAPAAGDGGVAPVAGEPAAGAAVVAGADGAGSAPLPGVGQLDAASLSEKWGEVANGFETAQEEFFRGDALVAVRDEHPKYFEALEKHPRSLVGTQVPRVDGKEGMETLRDASDAASWQDAAKRLLVAEVQSRVAAKQEEVRGTFETVHSSIDLFRNNVDLVPNTKQFDPELAKRFVSFAKEYEVRSEGQNKLLGWSVPVQPLINQLRTQLAAEKAAKPAAQAAPTPQQQRAAEQARTQVGTFAAPADAPQAGITSKAGSQGSGEDDVAAGVLSAFMRQNGFSI